MAYLSGKDEGIVASHQTWTQLYVEYLLPHCCILLEAISELLMMYLQNLWIAGEGM